LYRNNACNSISEQLIQALLAAAPDCAQVTDVYGRLALHYAVDKPTPNLAVVDCLLAAFPGGNGFATCTVSMCLKLHSVKGAQRSTLQFQ